MKIIKGDLLSNSFVVDDDDVHTKLHILLRLCIVLFCSLMKLRDDKFIIVCFFVFVVFFVFSILHFVSVIVRGRFDSKEIFLRRIGNLPE